MENTQSQPKAIPEEKFEAFLKENDASILISPIGFIYCAEGTEDSVRERRLEQLEFDARQKGATQAEMDIWDLRKKLLLSDWKADPAKVRDTARRIALATSPLQAISSIEARQAEYLCEPYLPRGMITILAGVAGQGKTTLALWLASQVSNGSLTPDGVPGTVFYFTMENDESIVLRPRLEAMGARLDRIVVQRGDKPQTTLDDPRLGTLTNLYGYRPDLIVFDPVQSYLGKKCDMNRTDDVRRVMDGLNRVLRDTNAAVLLICHTKKAPMGFNGRPTDLINGSSDFVNVARSVCFLGRDPAHPDVCVVAQEKNSLGLPGASLTFTIGENGAVQWSEEECDMTAQQIITYSDEKRQHAERPGERALRVLREMLEEKGRMSSAEVIEHCAKRGITRSAVYRARDKLLIQEQRTGQGSFWSLPAKSQNAQLEKN